MTPAEALEVLDAHSPPGENWPLHSRQVAKVAVRLCAALKANGAEADRDVQEVQALLHDIGRSRTHGPLHGWSGYTLLRSLGLGQEGRGCLTHWLKGRSQEETVRTGRFEPDFMARVYGALDPPQWHLGDSIMSVADSSVQHSTIVPLDQRHADLLERYGESEWLRRATELGDEHACQVGAAAGKSVEEVVPHLERLRKNVEETAFTLRGPARPIERPQTPVPTPSQSKQVSVTVSIGVAQRADRRSAPSEALGLADAALYRAKKAGRNRVKT